MEHNEQRRASFRRGLVFGALGGVALLALMAWVLEQMELRLVLGAPMPVRSGEIGEIAWGVSGGGPPRTAAPSGAEASGELNGAAGPRNDAAGPRNLVLLLADGLGFSHVMAARALGSGVHTPLAFERWPVVGWQTTFSGSNLITDSAASATALATGWPTHNRAVGVDLEGTARRTLLEAAQLAGKQTGLITDSYLWDATPASFVAHVSSRRESEAIVRQMAVSGTTVVIGGDDEIEAGSEVENKIQGIFTDAGYRWARDRQQALALLADGDPVTALLPVSQLASMEADANGDLWLVELAEATMAHLSRMGQGFVLVVETEETDTASHRADLERAVRGIRALEQAAIAALRFAQGDGQTLVVLSADHETGGLALIEGEPGQALGYRWSTRGHSAEPVPIYAWGPGAEQLSGVHHNTELGHRLAQVLGLALE